MPIAVPVPTATVNVPPPEPPADDRPVCSFSGFVELKREIAKLKDDNGRLRATLDARLVGADGADDFEPGADGAGFAGRQQLLGGAPPPEAMAAILQRHAAPHTSLAGSLPVGRRSAGAKPSRGPLLRAAHARVPMSS